MIRGGECIEDMIKTASEFNQSGLTEKLMQAIMGFD
jgi:hypothetical protein